MCLCDRVVAELFAKVDVLALQEVSQDTAAHFRSVFGTSFYTAGTNSLLTRLPTVALPPSDKVRSLSSSPLSSRLSEFSTLSYITLFSFSGLLELVYMLAHASFLRRTSGFATTL